MHKFNDKIVVVTGGAGGIGYAIVENFLQKSVTKVIIVDMNEKLGISAIDSLKSRYGDQRVIFCKGNVTTDLDVLFKEILESHKTIHILVNCAGVSESAVVENTININVTALLNWSLKFYDHMRVDKSGCGGTIINIGSVLSYQTIPYAPVYQASKFAVLGFGKSLGHHENFNRFGVRVITLCPGFTETNLKKSAQLKLFDLTDDFERFEKTMTFQTADVVGKAAVDVFEIAESGTAWEIANSRPLVKVS